MTGVFEAFLAGIYAEIKMVTRLSAAAAAMAGTDTDKVRGTVLWIIFRNFPATTGSRSRTLPIPANMPAGIPAAPMQSPSNSTEFRSCYDVAPTDERIPNWRMRSFSEILKEL